MIVGVDPGLKTGVAVYLEEEGVLISAQTLAWWDAMEYLTGELAGASLVVVEDPSQNAPVFARGLSGPPLMRLAQNVGANKMMATLMIEGLRRKKIPVRPVRPSKEKWDAAQFAQHFSCPGRQSQHARDAARLIHLHTNGK